VVLISHNLHDIFGGRDRGSRSFALAATPASFERSKTTQEAVVHAITAGDADKVSGIADTATPPVPVTTTAA